MKFLSIPAADPLFPVSAELCHGRISLAEHGIRLVRAAGEFLDLRHGIGDFQQIVRHFIHRTVIQIIPATFFDLDLARPGNHLAG